MKERPKRTIVSALNRDDYSYYDSVSVHRQAEEKLQPRPQRRQQQSSSLARTYGPSATTGVPKKNTSSLQPQQVKNLEVRLERLDEIMGSPRQQKAASKMIPARQYAGRKDLNRRRDDNYLVSLPQETTEVYTNHGECVEEIDESNGNPLGTDSDSDASLPEDAFFNSNVFGKKPVKSPAATITASNNMFQCPQCSSSFAEQRYLEFHSKVHTKQKKPRNLEQISKFTCLQKNCFQQCVTYEDLMLHMRKSHPERPQQISESHEKSGNIGGDRGSSSNQPKFFFSKVIDAATGFESFKCSYCLATFSFKPDLSAHIRQHREGNPLSCTTCQKTFPNLDALRTHMRRHETNKTFKCPDCPRKLASEESLKIHASFHNSEKLYDCQECSQSFPSNSSLLNHRMTNHNSSLPFQCKRCALYFPSMPALQRHAKTHLENANKRQHATEYADAHSSIHTEENITVAESILSDETGPEPKSSRLVLPKLFNESVAIIPGATHDNSLRIIRRKKAPASNDLDSDDLSSLIRAPVQELRTDEETLYNCDQEHCGMTFRLYSSYVRHCQIIHNIKISSEFVYEPQINVDKPINISVRSPTPKKFKTAEEIEKDLLKIHQCPYCSKRMTRKDALRIHINSHTGAKPYRCQFCDMSFGNPANLYRHKQIYCRVKRGSDMSLPIGLGDDSPRPGERPSSTDSSQLNNGEDEETSEENVHCQVDLSEAVPENVIAPPALFIQASDLQENDSLNLSVAGSISAEVFPLMMEDYMTQTSFMVADSNAVSELGSEKRAETEAPCSTGKKGDISSESGRTLNASAHNKIGNTEYECTTCQEKFFGYKDIVEHMHQHTSPGTFICHLCNKTLPSKSTLGVHFLIHFRVTFLCSAPNCNRKFSNKCMLAEHVKSHSDHFPFLCPKCGKDFPTSQSSGHHSTQYSNSSCVVEAKLTLIPASPLSDNPSNIKPRESLAEVEQLPQPEALTNHDQHNNIDIPEIQPETTDFFPCEYCNKIFASLFGLSRHFKAEHTDILEQEGRADGAGKEEDEEWAWDTQSTLPQKEQNIEVIDLASDTEEELGMGTATPSTAAQAPAEHLDDDEGEEDEFEGDEEN